MADRRLPALPLDGGTPLADERREQDGPQAYTPPRTPDPSPADSHSQPELNYAELHTNALPEFVHHSNLEVARGAWPSKDLLRPDGSATSTVSSEKYPAYSNDKYIFTGTNDRNVDCATGQSFGAGGVGESRLSSAPPSDRDKIWGMPRQVFCILLAAGAFLAVVGVALGVGLGIGLHQSDVTAAGSSSASSTSFPSTASSLPSAAASSLVLPSPTAEAVTGSSTTIVCGANNLTLYESQANSSRRFLLLCGRDYSSTGGSVDLNDSVTATFGECIDLCASDPLCIGAGWGDYNNQTFCWKKKLLSAPSWVPGWYFAIEDDAA